MKKFLTLVCMIACVFGLTACGSEEELTALEKSKVNSAEIYAVNEIVPDLQMFMDDDNVKTIEGYSAEEVEYMVSQNFGFNTEGYAFISAVTSFYSARDEIGKITNIGSAKGSIKGDQIVVYVEVEGEKKNAQAEVIFSNDMFLTLESASLNPISSMGELMVKAALNTVIGMGTVFAVLILISGIISLFRFIPKIQASFTKKKDDDKKDSGIDNAVAQIVGQEEIVDETDDLELVAVIAAAIAASEGAVSTDGFVVRSIRKANRIRL